MPGMDWDPQGQNPIRGQKIFFLNQQQQDGLDRWLRNMFGLSSLNNDINNDIPPLPQNLPSTKGRIFHIRFRKRYLEL